MANTKSRSKKTGRRTLRKKPPQESDATESDGSDADFDDPDPGPQQHLTQYINTYLVESSIMGGDQDEYLAPKEVDFYNDVLITQAEPLSVYADLSITANAVPPPEWNMEDDKVKATMTLIKKCLQVNKGKEKDAVGRIQRAMILDSQKKSRVLAMLVEKNNQRRHVELIQLLGDQLDCMRRAAASGADGVAGTPRPTSKASASEDKFGPWPSASARYSWMKEMNQVLNSPRYDDKDYFIDRNTMRSRLLGNAEKREADPQGFKLKVIAALADSSKAKNLWVSPVVLPLASSSLHDSSSRGGGGAGGGYLWVIRSTMTRVPMGNRICFT